MNPQTLSLAALVCFVAGSGVALAGLRNTHPRVSQLQLILVGLGVLLKTTSIGLACARGGSHFFNSPAEITGLLAWALGCSYLLALSISAARSLGALILPMVSVLMILAETLSKEQVNPGVPANNLFAVHIISAFLGYGLFLTACGASVFYLQQGRMLKQKAFGALFADLPSLERLEKLEMLCALLGFMVFSVAIGTGAVLAKELNKPFWLEPKVLSAQLTWLIFGALLLGRAVRWLNGRAAAKFVLAGAALVLFTFALGHPFGRPPEKAAAAPATTLRIVRHRTAPGTSENQTPHNLAAALELTGGTPVPQPWLHALPTAALAADGRSQSHHAVAVQFAIRNPQFAITTTPHPAFASLTSALSPKGRGERQEARA